MKLPRPTLMFVTAPDRRLNDIVREAIAGGVDAVQWREATVPSEVRGFGSALHIINSDIAAAVHGQADGVHLKEEGVAIAQARAAFDREVLVGRSVHSIEAAQFAESEGADYLIAGNIFETTSHPDLEPAGLAFLAAICESVTIPVLAIGGITPERVAECLTAGAAGIAVRSPLLEATNPREVAARYRRALRVSQ